MAEQEEPRGLGMSLDSLITKQKKSHGGRHVRSGGPDRRRAVDRLEVPVARGRGEQRMRGDPFMKHKDAHKKHEEVYQKEDGDVALKLFDTEIVVINKAGDITLNSGGFRGALTLASMCEALAPFGLSIKVSPDDKEDWKLTDGKRLLLRFTEGMVLPNKGPVDSIRQQVLLHMGKGGMGASQAAATAASLQVAASLGIYVEAGAGGRGGQGYGGRGRGRGGRFGGRGGRGGDGAGGGDDAAARRLKAQGRYNPY